VLDAFCCACHTTLNEVHCMRNTLGMYIGAGTIVGPIARKFVPSPADLTIRRILPSPAV